MTKRILISGAPGFVGSHLVKYILANTDWHITALDRLDEAASLSRLGKLSSRVDFIWHDLKAPLQTGALGHEALRKPFDYIAHLAAASHVDRSVRWPMQFLQDNVMGTAHMLEYAREVGCGKFLYFSTDEVFGDADRGEDFDEYARHFPTNPYAASKSAAESLCPAWAHTYGVPIVISHGTNFFGEGQDAEKFVPLAIGKIREGRMLQIHSRDGVPSTRFYLHAENTASAIVTILEKGGIIGNPETGRYNISGDVELSNVHVAERIADLLGKPLRHELVDFVPNRPRHDQRYAINSTRLEALGWKRTVSFEEGLRRTVESATRNA